MVGALEETIAAVASASGNAVRGIVRISGPNAVSCLQGCFQTADRHPLEANRSPRVFAGRVTVQLAETDATELPCDLYLWPTQKSYTRQPAAELHTLGSGPLLHAVLGAVCRAARLATSGEFTLRAFLAGRLDLVQAEAVLGIVDARDEGQRKTALRQLAGGLSRPLGALRDDLVSLLAELEAGLDFADEDIDFIPTEEITHRLSITSEKIQEVANQLQTRSELGATYRAVLTGPPNAGKSSLFNALVTRFAQSDARRHPAIVSAQPGTTRDYLQAELDLDGVVCELVDTAGLGPQRNAKTVDRAASDQTAEQRLEADLLLECEPAGQRKEPDDAAMHATENIAGDNPSTLDRLPIVTKNDSGTTVAGSASSICTSAVTGQGIAELAAAIRGHALISIMSHGEVVATTAVRCRESLRRAAELLDRARQLAEDRLGDELVASEVRAALHELGVVVGTVYTDDILDRIFANFCIGK